MDGMAKEDTAPASSSVELTPTEQLIFDIAFRLSAANAARIVTLTDIVDTFTEETGRYSVNVRSTVNHTLTAICYKTIAPSFRYSLVRPRRVGRGLKAEFQWVVNPLAVLKAGE